MNILAIDSGYNNVGVFVCSKNRHALFADIISLKEKDVKKKIFEIRRNIFDIVKKYSVEKIIIEDYRAGIDNMMHTYWHIASIWSMVASFEEGFVDLVNVNIWQKHLQKMFHINGKITKSLIKAYMLQYFDFTQTIKSKTEFFSPSSFGYHDSDAAGMVAWYINSKIK